MARLEENLGKWVVTYRWWIIVTTVLFVMAAGSGIRFLTFNNDDRVFFSKENPQLKALEALENTYNRIDSVLFVIDPQKGSVFTPETLSLVEELTEASWKIPYSSRVDSLTNFQHTRADGDDLIVEDLVENARELDDEALGRVRDIALTEPFLVNRIVSRSGNVTGVNVNILLPRKSIDEVPEVASFARNMVKEIEKKYSDVDIYLMGGVMFSNGFGEATENDLSTLVPLMFLTILLFIGFTLRSLTGMVATLAMIMISMITGMGFAGWAGLMLNPASGNAPTIILILAVADSVHILATMFHQMQLGKNREESIAESLRINLQPVFLTSATTAVGFLTMNFSDSPPFRDLGNIVAMGVMAAFVYSVTFLPALMAVFPMGLKYGGSDILARTCDRLATFVIDHRKSLFRGMLIIVILLCSGIPFIELNDNWMKYFDERYDIRRAAEFVDKNLSGFHSIEYSLESGEAGGINNPGYLTEVEKFANWYRQQPEVNHVNAITDIMKRLNRSMHGDDQSYYRIPESRELAAQYLLLYEMSLPFGLDLNNQINVDRSSTRMVVLLNDMPTRELIAMDDRARNWLGANAPESMFTYGSGLSVIWSHIAQRNINSMLGASFGALFLISGILIFALRSFRMGLLSLIPNLTPAFMAFGIWGLAVGQAGLSIATIVAMTLGIVVDDTIHFMSKYIRARREAGLNPGDAIRYAFNTVGTAMWVTTVALFSGFMVLSLSGFKLNSDTGLMTAITIVLALVLDFLFLPVILMKVDGKSDKLKQQKVNTQ